MLARPGEWHRTEHVGLVAGSGFSREQGILSTANLVPSVAAALESRSSVLVAGVAGPVAGGMSMAAGEYVSVHQQGRSCGVSVRNSEQMRRATSGGASTRDFRRAGMAGVFASRPLRRIPAIVSFPNP